MDKKVEEEKKEDEQKVKKIKSKKPKAQKTPILEYLWKALELGLTVFLAHRFYNAYFGHQSEFVAKSFHDFEKKAHYEWEEDFFHPQMLPGEPFRFDAWISYNEPRTFFQAMENG